MFVFVEIYFYMHLCFIHVIIAFVSTKTRIKQHIYCKIFKVIRPFVRTPKHYINNTERLHVN